MKKLFLTLFFLLFCSNSYSITYSVKDINESYSCLYPVFSKLKVNIYKLYITQFVTYTVTSYGEEKGVYLGMEQGNKIYGFNRNGRDLYFDIIEKDTNNSKIKFTRNWFTSDEIASFDEGNKSVLRDNLKFVKNTKLPEDLFKNEGRIFMLNKNYTLKLLDNKSKSSETFFDKNETICNKN